MKSKTDLFVYHYTALYREPIFKKLSESKKLNFHLACDDKTNTTITIIDRKSSLYHCHFTKLNNHWINHKYLWQRGLLKTLIKSKNDLNSVVFLGDPNFITTWLALILLKFTSVKTYLWTHGFILRGGIFQRLIKLMYYRLSDGLLLYGKQSYLELIEHGIPKRKLSIIYNSLNYDSQSELRHMIKDVDLERVRFGIFRQTVHFQLFFVGRFTHHKKLDDLIYSLHQLVHEGINATLLMIGDGDAKDEIKNTVVKLDLLDRVHFFGACHDESTLSHLICSSDVCVSPGEVGLTAMHSLGYGVPVVTHSDPKKQMPEYEAIVPGLTGELFKEGSVKDMTNAIKKVYTNGKMSYSSNCIDIIEERYTPTAQLNIIVDSIYN